MPCNEIAPKLEAFVDGECSIEDQQAVQDHLRNCSACSDQIETLSQLNKVVADNLGAVKAPADLWQKIEDRLPGSIDAQQTPKEKQRFSGSIRHLAIAASFVLLLALPAGVAWWQMHLDGSIALASIQDFETYRASERALDIASDDPDEVRSWFEGKLVFDLPKIEAEVAGFELIGGRLCWFLERRLGTFAYQRGDQTISLYVMRDHDLVLPKAVFEPRLNISLSSHRLNDLYNLIWHVDGLIYTVVSDVTKQGLSLFLASLARVESTFVDAAVSIG